jgi:protein ImuB
LALTALNPAAVAAGLQLGLPLAAARAAIPALRVQEQDVRGQAAGLRRLARWCVRFSPLTAPLEDGIVMDCAGVAHLFGGEAALVAHIAARFGALGLSAQVAMADTIGAAVALARFDPRASTPTGAIAAPGAQLAAVLALPVAALRLEPRTAQRLTSLGLKRIADLARLPRASLARRFGRGLLDRLDQAAGLMGEPLDSLAHDAPIIAQVRFAEPVMTQDALAEAGRRLCGLIAAQLKTAGLGARRLVFRAFRVDGACLDLAFGAARAETDGAKLARLLQERLHRAEGRFDLGFGVDAAALIVADAQREVLSAQDLDPDAARRAAAQAAARDLTDRFAARFGADAVIKLSPRASHLPERAQHRTDAPAPFAAPPPETRPLFLFARAEPIEATAEVPEGPPRRFRWRRVLHRVIAAEGPERIAAEWWRNAGLTRDYFRVETETGRRLWLCRQGLYGRETDTPKWFVHGAFG